LLGVVALPGAVALPGSIVQRRSGPALRRAILFQRDLGIVAVVDGRPKRCAHRLDQPFGLLGKMVDKTGDRSQLIRLLWVVAVCHPFGGFLDLPDLEQDCV
jgi:hypothetical protein